MRKILFVCHGNICRSPMAEFMMKHMTDKKTFHIESRATSTDALNLDIHSGTRKILDKKGIPYESRKATQMTYDDYEYFDEIYIMDEKNRRIISHIIGDDPLGKVRKLLGERDIADPWYTHDFEATYNDILEGIHNIL